MHCCLTIPQFKTLSDFSVDFSHAAITSLQLLPSAQAKWDLINFFPWFKKKWHCIGFQSSVRLWISVIWLCFSHFIGQKPNSTRCWVVTMYTSSFSPQYTHLTLDCQHTHSPHYNPGPKLCTHLRTHSKHERTSDWFLCIQCLPLKVAKLWLAICLPCKSPQSSELNLVAVPWLRQVTVSFLSYGCKMVAEQASFTVQFNLNKFTFNFKEENEDSY
jgi:hypothetical protein